MRRDFVSERSKSVMRSGIRVMVDSTFGIEGLVHLEIGEPDFSTPAHIVEAAKEALAKGYTHYTPNAGFLDLRESISRKLLRRNKIEADPESEIIVTAGAMQGISSALLVTLDPGDEVLIPDPGYESFVRQTRFAGAIPVPVRVREEDDFRLQPQEVENAITKKTKVIIVNSPANPTGSVMSKSDVEGIAELATRHDLFVLSDEIYENMLYDGVTHCSIGSLPGMEERTMTVFAFSKSYAMTGWRVGYVAAPKATIKEMVKLQEFYVTCATSFCQKAAVAALEGPQECVRNLVSEFKRRRDFMHDEIVKMRGISCVTPKGAFYLFPNVSRTRLGIVNPAMTLLEKCKVVTAPGTAFGKNGNGYLRISLAAPMSDLSEAAERMRAYLGST